MCAVWSASGQQEGVGNPFNWGYIYEISPKNIPNSKKAAAIDPKQ
jgi:hypothetical protein